MAWLSSLLKKPESEEQDPALAEAELIPEEAAIPVPTGPQLAVLVPDMAGISSFRVQTLPDATSASEHIASLKPDIRHETHAFWALHDKPIVDEGTHVEALVLIRAQAGSDLVYVVSFLDIESALSFTRFEVRRGLHLGNVMIYWAAFAQLREELDGISVTPEFAPPTENYVPPVPVYDEVVAPAPEASIAVAEPETAPEPTIEPELGEEPAAAMQAVEEYLRAPEQQKRRIIEPAPEQIAEAPDTEELPAAEPVAEEPIAMQASAITEPTIDATDDDLGPMWPEANADVLAAEPETADDLSSPVAEEQAAINGAFVFQHKTVEFKPNVRLTALETLGAENGMLVEEAQVAETPVASAAEDKAVEQMVSRMGIADPEPGVESFPGDEEMEFVPLNSADPAAGFATTPKLDDFDVAYEVERLLRGRKWEQRDGPFSGFRSPPGRF